MSRQWVRNKAHDVWEWVRKKVQKELYVTSSFTLAFLIFLVLASIYYKTDLGDVLVEAWGLLMDLLVFGILFLWLNQRRERERQIRSLKDQLEDFCMWGEKEGIFRKVGIIKRLNSCGVSSINLVKSDLCGAELSHADLRKADLSRANLSGVNLFNANLSEANLSGADLSHASLGVSNLNDADLSHADLSHANLYNTPLNGVNLSHANLFDAKLSGTDLSHANLFDANLENTDLEYAHMEYADLSRARELTVEQLIKTISLYQAKMDPTLKADVMKTNPELFDEPEG